MVQLEYICQGFDRWSSFFDIEYPVIIPGEKIAQSCLNLPINGSLYAYIIDPVFVKSKIQEFVEFGSGTREWKGFRKGLEICLELFELS